MRGRGFIPSLSALRAFEAVARKGNFVTAAEALNLSVGAVSHQVTKLEANLGVALFLRADARGRQTRLTKAGEELLNTVESTLDRLAEACDAVRRRKKSAKRTINVSANAPTCSPWLAPRLARYAALNNRVDIRVSAVEGEPEMRDSGLDLAIVRLRRNGQMTQRPINRDIYLMGETVFPVCSPRVLELTPDLGSDPRCLEKVQLLQEENTDSPELDWETWFPRIGADPRARGSLVRCSGFSPVVAAAVAGGGVALGRSPLIDLELASGRLVKLFGVSGMIGSWEFYIRTTKQMAEDPELRILIDYLTAEAQTSLP